MKIYFYSTLALLILFTSCQKIVDADKLLDAKEKVYIVGFLSPNDTVFRVNVSKALPAVGTQLPAQDYEAFREAFLIKNATVSISDEIGNETNLVYSDSLETYLADASTLTIESEKQYFLEVTVSDKTYNASCYIPKKIGEIEHEAEKKTNEFGETFAELKLRFQDFANEKNFYMYGGSYKSTYTFEDQEPQEIVGPLFFNENQFLTDNIFDGGTLGGSGKLYIGTGAEISNTSAILQVAHMEEIIFQYMRAADLNYEADGNPFVEYSIASNNILDDGAIGVFAGYQVTEKVIEVDL